MDTTTLSTPKDIPANTTNTQGKRKMSSYRAVIILICFIGIGFLLHGATGTHPISIVKPLDTFPKHLGNWTLEATHSSSEDIVIMLGVDDYIHYVYKDDDGNRIVLYVGFYESVGGGKGYHSPKNCLPGGGWGIDSVNTIQVTPVNRQDSPVDITKMIIRSGSESQVVFYWFQNRGRIIASEYLEKIYLVYDALTKKRRDGAFIRLMAHAHDGNIAKTEELLQGFAELTITKLDKYLPGKHLHQTNHQ